MTNLSKIKYYIEKLINTVTIRKDENGKLKNIYFSRPIVLPSTETNVENNYKESIMIIHKWIDEIMSSDIKVEDEKHLRKILLEKLKNSI